MMRLLRTGSLLFLGASLAAAQVLPQQQQGAPSVETGSIPLTYNGGDNRVSVGVDKDGNTEGQLLGVFGNNGEHAFVGQLWWGHGGSGGIQGDYNWLFGTTLEQARKDPDSITVAKLSFAIDQNDQSDRQANVGFAIERKEFFLNFFLSAKASGSRNAGALTTQQQTVVTGTDSVGNFTQTTTDVSTTALEAQPFEYTVGVHGGHFSDDLAARFNGGFDYAKGHQGANQKRVSLGVDKYLGIRGWSISALAEHAENSGILSNNPGDNRWWLFLRYEFGGPGIFLPSDQTADTAWIQRALHEPVTGHVRTIDTYVTRGKTTTTTTAAPKQYTARFPIARDDTATVSENSSNNTIDVIVNDNDPDGNPLSITATTQPANGSVQISGNRLVYTPKSGFTGTDQFTYTITNTKGLSATAKVTVTVIAGTQPPPGGPTAKDDSATTALGTPVVVNVLANDSSPAGYPLTVTTVTPPAHGTAQIGTGGAITYTPNSTYIGSDRFTYTISDGHGGTATANVTITVLAPQGPIAVDDTATTAVATPVTINVLANDRDPAGNPLSVVSVTSPGNGTAQINADNTVTYTPDKTFVGTDRFAYTISNGHGGSATANVTVTVQQQGPIAVDDTATTTTDTSVGIYVLANDTSPAGYLLFVTSISQPSNGTATINPGGVVAYTPKRGFFGTDAFSYTISDGHGGVASANVTVTVLPPAGAFVAQNDSAKTLYATAVSINVLANDSAPAGLTLTLQNVSAPSHGTAQITTGGMISYTPSPSFNGGSDTFTYTVSDGFDTRTATVTVTVQAPGAPTPANDAATTPFNKPVTINVLANDSDPQNLALSVTAVGTPSHGTAQINPNNTITYTPQSTYFGTDTFTYTVSNGHAATANASVTVTVQPPLPPVAVNDAAGTAFCTAVKIAVLANDSDPNGLPLAVSVTTPPQFGSAAVNPDNTITYTPDCDSSGIATFKYTISDGFNSATASVNVTVAAPVPPIAVKDTATTAFNTPVTIAVLANDSDPNGQTLFISSFTQPPVGGSVTQTPPSNTLTFTPTAGYVGSAGFSYTISDGFGSASTTVTVTVQPPPAATAISFTVPSTLGCAAAGEVCGICFDSHISNPSSLTLTFSVSPTSTAGGAVSIQAIGGCTYGAVYTSSASSTSGSPDSFNFSVQDVYNRTSTGTASLTLN
jgi:hypothetical protein